MPLGFDEARKLIGRNTMLGEARLRALYAAIVAADARGSTGCIVEAGCYRGGSAALAALASSVEREIWLFDSFQGMPAPTGDDPDRTEASRHTGRFSVTPEHVLDFYAAWGLSQRVRIVPGWFTDTLPCPGVPPIALLHVDADWYDGTKRALEAFYPLVEPGGTIQIDDYGHWKGCCKATDAFLLREGIRSPLTAVDYTAHQLVKGSIG